MSASQDQPLLIVTAGAGRGRSAPLRGSVTIGRDDQNALVIPDAALSRRHCVVEASDGHVVVKDLDSKNGVFVNGCPVRERALADGDQIRIGDSIVIVVTGQLSLTAAKPSPRIAPASAAPTDTLVLDDSVYLAAGESPAHATADGLRHLVALGIELQRAATVASVCHTVLRHATAAVTAGGGAVVTWAVDAAARVMLVHPEQFEVRLDATLLAQLSATRAAVSTADGAVLTPLPCGDGDHYAVWVKMGHVGPAQTDDALQWLAAMGSIGGMALERALRSERLEHEATALRRDAAVTHSIVGESPAIRKVLDLVGRVAATDTTVLIEGESGTGKEVVARAIHDSSPRARGPFVAINCAALPEALLESELFGHERGAFTGAVSQQRGRLELADRGTVLLDEVGELAPPLQAKVLRVIEDRLVERVGGRRGTKIDVRILAATNVDLKAAVSAGKFRPDLFHRLNVVSLRLPALRERRDDIPLLAAYFIQRHAARCKRRVRGLSPAARRLLVAYDWPGNIRELSNTIERAVVLGASELIEVDDLPEPVVESSTTVGDNDGYHARVAASRRLIIQEALARHAHNVAAAARELDLQVTYLHRLIRQLNIRPPS